MIRDTFFTALSMGLMAKSPTVEEVLGFCHDRRNRIGSIKVSVDASKIIDLSGGGGDNIKTINVSTAASLVAATGGLSVAKQAAAAFTGFLGSSDLLNELGIPIFTDNIERIKIKEELERNNFVAYNYAALSPERFTNFFRWRKKAVNMGLKYFIPWHIASFAYSPIEMENRIYGLANPRYMRLFAEVLRRLGHKRILVVHGMSGLDEISNVGRTKIIEVKKRKIIEYCLSPKDFGVRKAKVEDITIKNRKEGITQFLKVLKGKGKEALHDLVAINAGAAFYLTGIRKSYKEGTRYASRLIEIGKVSDKLKNIVSNFETLS